MKKILITFLMLFSSLSFAIEPQVGVNFDKTVQVVPTDNKDKIEITELFWYGCIHCYQMDPMLSDWVKKLPKDKLIFLICYVGHTSSQVLTLLKMLGYNVISIKYGYGLSPIKNIPIAGWLDYKLPTISSK